MEPEEVWEDSPGGTEAGKNFVAAAGFHCPVDDSVRGADTDITTPVTEGDEEEREQKEGEKEGQREIKDTEEEGRKSDTAEQGGHNPVHISDSCQSKSLEDEQEADLKVDWSAAFEALWDSDERAYINGIELHVCARDLVKLLDELKWADKQENYEIEVAWQLVCMEMSTAVSWEALFNDDGITLTSQPSGTACSDRTLEVQKDPKSVPSFPMPPDPFFHQNGTPQSTVSLRLVTDHLPGLGQFFHRYRDVVKCFATYRFDDAVRKMLSFQQFFKSHKHSMYAGFFSMPLLKLMKLMYRRHWFMTAKPRRPWVVAASTAVDDCATPGKMYVRPEKSWMGAFFPDVDDSSPPEEMYVRPEKSWMGAFFPDVDDSSPPEEMHVRCQRSWAVAASTAVDDGAPAEKEASDCRIKKDTSTEKCRVQTTVADTGKQAEEQAKEQAEEEAEEESLAYGVALIDMFERFQWCRYGGCSLHSFVWQAMKRRASESKDLLIQEWMTLQNKLQQAEEAGTQLQSSYDPASGGLDPSNPRHAAECLLDLESQMENERYDWCWFRLMTLRTQFDDESNKCINQLLTFADLDILKLVFCHIMPDCAGV